MTIAMRGASLLARHRLDRARIDFERPRAVGRDLRNRPWRDVSEQPLLERRRGAVAGPTCSRAGAGSTTSWRLPLDAVDDGDGLGAGGGVLAALPDRAIVGRLAAAVVAVGIRRGAAGCGLRGGGCSVGRPPSVRRRADRWQQRPADERRADKPRRRRRSPAARRSAASEPLRRFVSGRAGRSGHPCHGPIPRESWAQASTESLTLVYRRERPESQRSPKRNGAARRPPRAFDRALRRFSSGPASSGSAGRPSS